MPNAPNAANTQGNDLEINSLGRIKSINPTSMKDMASANHILLSHGVGLKLVSPNARSGIRIIMNRTASRINGLLQIIVNFLVT